MVVLCTALVVLDTHQDGDFLGIREALGFDGTVGQQEDDQTADYDRQAADCDEEDAPACEVWVVCEGDTVGDGAAEDLGQAVAHVEPRYAASLLFFLVPCCCQFLSRRGFFYWPYLEGCTYTWR